MDYGAEIAEAGLRINAIEFRPYEPFTLDSGLRVPILSDPKRFLLYPDLRKLIAQGFENLLNMGEISYDIVAGTSTSGISFGTTLADLVYRPFVYMEDKPSQLQSQKAVLIENLIVTGKTSIENIKSIRDAKGFCNYCLSIFDYELVESKKAFNNLNPKCKFISIIGYETLLNAGKRRSLTNDQVKLVEEWRENPTEWGKKH